MKKFILILGSLLTLAIALVSVFVEPAAATGLMGVGILAGLNPQERAELLQLVKENMNFEGDELYEGSDDDFVDFDGPNGSFLTEATGSNRQYTMTITNANLAAKDFMLTPGYLWSPEYGNFAEYLSQMEGEMTIERDDLGSGIPAADVDYTVDLTTKSIVNTRSKGFIREGRFMATNALMDSKSDYLTASGSPYTVEEFFAFLMYNPTNLLAMKIQSNGTDGAQIAYPLEVVSQSPFKQLESKPIYPSSSINQNSYQNSLVVFDTKGIVLGNQTQIKYKIAPAIDAQTPRSISVTFFCGAVMNTTQSLVKKQTKAIKNFGAALANVKHPVVSALKK